jgi:glycosyltransferase involved in cell wall biosynthesis
LCLVRFCSFAVSFSWKILLPKRPTLPEPLFRVLILSTHVIPYGSSLFRLLARSPRLDLLVAYCSMQGAHAGLDPEFGIEIRWDTPLLEGYPWVLIPNRSPVPGFGRFFGLVNPGLWKLIRSQSWDAVVIYTGYMCASFWIACFAAKSRGIPVLISSDATTLQQREGKRWKALLKPFVLARVYRYVDVLMAPSQPVKDLAMQLGKPEKEIVMMRSAVDKDAWRARLKNFDRDAVRTSWSVPPDAVVVLYCAKLQPWKRPLDLLRAFAKASVPGSYLVFAGEGPQRPELEREVASLGITDGVRILGFVNDSQLPGAYKAADLFVLPSEYDPCPLVVPEAMFSGLPVLLSDAVMGRLEMIDPGKSGYPYPCGNADALATLLRKILGDHALLRYMRESVAQQMERWTAADLLDSWVGAIEVAKQLQEKQVK